MNDWRFRLLMAAIGWLAMDIHSDVTANLPNTDMGMLAFHGSAAAVELVLIFCMPWLLEGRLCDDMQTLSLVSMIANALGWALYLASLPPVFYNTFMWGLSCVQLGRLLMVDRHDADTLGCDLVRRPHIVGA